MSKLNASVATPQEIAGNTYVHNHSVSVASAILAGALGLGVVVPSGAWWLWTSGAYVVEQAGFKNGEETLANWLILTLAGGVGLVFMLVIFRYGINAVLDYRLAMADKEIEKLRVMHMLQNSVVADSRETEPELKRRNALIVALATDALQGRVNLSYRKAGEYVLAGEASPVGKDSNAVREALNWLKDNGAVVGNKWTSKYTSIGQLQRELHAPIITRGENAR